MTTRTLPTRPRDLPSRMVNWLIGALTAVIVLLIIGLAAAVAGHSIYYEVNRTKAGDVDEMIKKELPAGASTASILSFLDSKGIEHGPPAPAGANDLKVLETGVPRGTMVIPAIVRNEGYSLKLGKIRMSLLIDLADVEMRFVLDEAGNLKQHMVYEDHHRPTLLDLNAGNSED